MFFFPFGAALSSIIGRVYDKYILSRFKINYRLYTVVIFYFLFFIAFVFALFLGKISTEAFTFINLLAFLLVVILAAAWNLLWYHGVAEEKLIEVELISILYPLATILMASIFLPAERNIHHLLAAIIASLALIWAHFKKHHLYFDQYQKGLLVAVLLMGLETVLVRYLLNFYSPATLYAVRTFLLSIVLTLFVRPQFKLEPKVLPHMFLVAFIWVLHMVFSYYGFQAIGVILTILFLILVPIIVYFISVIFFHEKLTYKHVVATIVILAAIVYATTLS